MSTSHGRDGLGENDLVAWSKKKKRKTRSEVGKGSGKSNKAEESDTWRRSKLENMAKSSWEPVTGVTLGSCCDRYLMASSVNILQ